MYDITNTYTKHIKKFIFNRDGATTIRDKNQIKYEIFNKFKFKI